MRVQVLLHQRPRLLHQRHRVLVPLTLRIRAIRNPPRPPAFSCPGRRSGPSTLMLLLPCSLPNLLRPRRLLLRLPAGKLGRSRRRQHTRPAPSSFGLEQRRKHHLDHVLPRVRPCSLHLGRPRLPQPLLQRPQQRLPHHWKVIRHHPVLCVPPPQRLQHRHQCRHVLQPRHCLSHRPHHLRRMLAQLRAVGKVRVVPEAKQLQRGRRNLEDAQEELDAVRVQVLLHQRP